MSASLPETPAFVPASNLSLGAFVLILVGVSAAILWAVHHASRSTTTTWRTALLLGAWWSVHCGLAATGRLESLPLRGLPFFFLPVFVVWSLAAFSKLGGSLAANLPLSALVLFHGFRLPLELVLHSWASQGTIPATMTWTGQNWDIATGVLALVCAPLANTRRWVAQLFNVIGLALLLNVIRVALLSSPVPFGWKVTPPLMLAFHLPYTLIGPVCVGGALFGHLVMIRALWSRPAPE